jgi:hypothetical protein
MREHTRLSDEPCSVNCPANAGAWAAAAAQRFTETLGPHLVSSQTGPLWMPPRVKIDHPFVTERSTKAEILKAFGDLRERSDRAIELLGEQVTRERQDMQSRLEADRERSDSLLNQHREQASRERQRLQEVIGTLGTKQAKLEDDLERAKAQVDGLTTALVIAAREQDEDDA